MGVSLAVLWDLEKLTKILPSFHSQADLTVSLVGHPPPIWDHLARRKADPCVLLKPLRARRVGLHIRMLSVDGSG